MTLFENEHLTTEIEDCAEKYLSLDKYWRTREIHMTKNYMGNNPLLLKEWVIAFNEHLHAKGENENRTVKDWIWHLFNWLKFRDCRTSPPKEEKKIQPTTKLQQNITANLSAKEKNRLLHERNSNNQ